MKRLDQVYDKMQEQTKADEKTTKMICSTVKLFAKLYGYFGNKDFHSHCCKYLDISQYEISYEEWCNLCQTTLSMQKVKTYMKKGIRQA